jgi:phospholipid/cholesterol/gamma-HCH transport system permease protein
LLAPVALTGRGFLYAPEPSPAALRCSRARDFASVPAAVLWRLFVRRFVEFGYFSLPVVALTAVFTGMVLALQSPPAFAKFGADERDRQPGGHVGGARTGPVLAG